MLSSTQEPELAKNNLNRLVAQSGPAYPQLAVICSKMQDRTIPQGELDLFAADASKWDFYDFQDGECEFLDAREEDFKISRRKFNIKIFMA